MLLTFKQLRRLINESRLCEAVNARVIAGVSRTIAEHDNLDPAGWADFIIASSETTQNIPGYGDMPKLQTVPGQMFGTFVRRANAQQEFAQSINEMSRAAWGAAILAYTDVDFTRMRDLRQTGETISWRDTSPSGGYLIAVKQDVAMPERNVVNLSMQLQQFLMQGGTNWVSYGEFAPAPSVHLLIGGLPLGDIKRLFSHVEYQKQNINNTEVGMRAAERARELPDPIRDYSRKDSNVRTVHTDGGVSYD